MSDWRAWRGTACSGRTPASRRYQGLIARGTATLSEATWEALTKACASLSIAPPPALAAEPRPSDSASSWRFARTGGRSRALPG